jgi:hypothetical protein
MRAVPTLAGVEGAIPSFAPDERGAFWRSVGVPDA